ncbi:MAG: DUF2997 domain-containing protein [Verrucomicrobia bacterium]|jgi:hypothetical protein|nr:DUF2997 domain-containing protein [Verrucomicrobiota bacterium]MBT7067484.1 DUF2997 domain-containing protein [Verrucomicrobiota bacterium]
MNRTIDVIVDAAGHIQIDAVGFQGADCEKATAFLEAALGQVAGRERKPEYMARRAVSRKQQVGR